MKTTIATSYDAPAFEIRRAVSAAQRERGVRLTERGAVALFVALTVRVSP